MEIYPEYIRFRVLSEFPATQQPDSLVDGRYMEGTPYDEF